MPTVLVVDDSDVDRRLVSGLLRANPGLKIESSENGARALDHLATSPADLVITDLQMPELDGLGLVRAIRVRFPQIPVILMTAHGSEELAIEALEQGAASYVPKAQLADMLQDTVAQVLALTCATRNYERLSACQTRAEFTFMLENDAELIDPLVDLIQQIVFRMGLCDATGRFRVGMALQQALLNALYHGNLEISYDQVQEARESLLTGRASSLLEQRRSQTPYRERRIFVDVRIGTDQAQFLIRDEGPGFDVSRLQTSSNGHGVELEGGRGLRLMRTFMDEVAYNPVGNEVTMIKRREGQAQ